MEIKITFVLMFLANFFQATVSTCRTRNIDNCVNSEHVEELQLKAFFSKTEWKTTCREMESVFHCIYGPQDLLRGCDEAEKYSYDMQKNVYDIVCSDDKDYLNHVDCLGSTNIDKDAIDNKLYVIIDDGEEMACSDIEDIRSEVSEIIRTTSGCGEGDVKYMYMLTHHYLKPAIEYTNPSCQLIKPEKVKIDTTTTTASTISTLITIITNKTLDTNMTSVGQNTTKQGAASVLTQQSVFIAGMVVVTKLIIIMN